MRLPALLVFSSVCFAAHASTVPRFEDHPAKVQHHRLTRVKLADAKSRMYEKILRATEGRKPNFAGHYVLTSWGCGASCTMSAAIDTGTGTVSWLPFTVCCWAPEIAEPLQFRADSRLLIVHGSRNEHGGGVHYYTIEGRQFSELAP